MFDGTYAYHARVRNPTQKICKAIHKAILQGESSATIALLNDDFNEIYQELRKAGYGFEEVYRNKVRTRFTLVLWPDAG